MFVHIFILSDQILYRDWKSILIEKDCILSLKSVEKILRYEK